MDEHGVQSNEGCVNDHFFCFVQVQLKVVFSAPLCEMRRVERSPSMAVSEYLCSVVMGEAEAVICVKSVEKGTESTALRGSSAGGDGQ